MSELNQSGFHLLPSGMLDSSSDEEVPQQKEKVPLRKPPKDGNKTNQEIK